MRILAIIMIAGAFSGLCAGGLPDAHRLPDAGRLPADFKFKPADSNKRSSFISQFKQYQEDKEKAEDQKLGQASLEHDSSQLIEAHDTIEGDNDAPVNFMEKCRQFIAKMVAYFNAGK